MTVGHLDVVQRASALFDEVVVAVLHNPDKQGTFTADERVALIEASCAGLPNVRVIARARTLLVEVCREVDAPVVVKGLRSDTDYDYELPMAIMNRELTGLETMFLPGAPALGHLSSSLIRQVAGLGGDVSTMVPGPVLGPLLERVRPQA